MSSESTPGIGPGISGPKLVYGAGRSIRPAMTLTSAVTYENSVTILLAARSWLFIFKNLETRTVYS